MLTNTMIWLLVGSIFVSCNAYSSLWPPHGLLGPVASATGAITGVPLVSTVVQPLAISTVPAKTTVAGPTSGATVIKGSVAGPVWITAGSSSSALSGSLPVPADQGSVAIGSSSDGSITVTEELDGSTRTAVVGPSTGPVVVAGPNASPPETPPLVVPVSQVDGVLDSSVGLLGSSAAVLVKGTSAGSKVIEGSSAGPVISQEIIDNSILVFEPKVKVLTPPIADGILVTGSPKIQVSGSSTGGGTTARLKSATAFISGPSGTIVTSNRK